MYDIKIDPKINNDLECLHDNCPSCNGTGRKNNGERCVHMISCQCRKCNKISL